MNRLFLKINFVYYFLMALFLTSCGSEEEKGLKIAASSVPHAQILEFIKPTLLEVGVNLIIIVSDDYNRPNRALANNEIDANFFQHTPFLDEQIKHFHYPIKNIAGIEIEPMGIYSKKIYSLSELHDNGTVAIPNDPTNESRALRLLQDNGIITLDDPDNLHATILNITHNPKKLKFIEVDAAMLPRTLEDVDLAAINTNYALQANLFTHRDALAIEGINSPYVNILVVRIEDENKKEILALKSAMTSETMRQFILQKYKGTILPAF